MEKFFWLLCENQTNGCRGTAEKPIGGSVVIWVRTNGPRCWWHKWREDGIRYMRFAVEWTWRTRERGLDG